MNVELCEKTEFRHDNHGSMSKGGAEGTDERVLALNTDVCETRDVGARELDRSD